MKNSDDTVSPATAAPQISVIVPTYREAENLPPLTHKISDILRAADYDFEIIIADDDSADGSREVCADLSSVMPITLLSRTKNRGLAAAVIDGIGVARGDVVIVMDADLSHPPEKIPQMAALLLSREYDFVLGSRYVAGSGVDEKWPWWRRVNSLAASLPARWLVPLADPMSGFFGLRRADVPPPDRLSPVGYKIGLELAVRCRFTAGRMFEVPIYFQDRTRGTSKMNFNEQLNYLRHLRRLYHFRWEKRMEVLQFLLVGATGLMIDLAFYFMLQAFGAPHVLARAIAYWPAMSFNWFLNRIMTFKERARESMLQQWARYAVGGGLGFVVSWGAYTVLTHTVFSDNLLPAFFLGVVAGTVFNFIFSDKLVFRRKEK